MPFYKLVFALCPPDEQLVESNQNCGQCNLCKSSLPCTLQVFCLVGKKPVNCFSDNKHQKGLPAKVKGQKVQPLLAMSLSTGLNFLED